MASASPYNVNLVSLLERFHSDERCREYLERLRWPDGVVCLRCSSKDVTELPKRDLWQCSSCRYQFSVTTDTIMHRSHLPLHKWFIAVYLTVEAKQGVSANQLARTLDVHYRTAWHLAHRIREAFRTPTALLSGVIEVDETWVGGKTRGRGKGYLGNKTMVVGAAERGGDVRMETGETPNRRTLHGFIDRTVADDAEAIYTDEHPGYGDLSDGDTRHERVEHRKEDWVRGDVYTNTIEGAWALFKRSVVGSYRKVSKKHLARYLDEFEFRFNNRKTPHIFRDALRELVGATPLEYRSLIG